MSKCTADLSQQCHLITVAGHVITSAGHVITGAGHVITGAGHVINMKCQSQKHGLEI